MLVRCALVAFVLTLSVLLAGCPDPPPPRSEPATPAELLDNLNRTIRDVESRHAGQALEDWPEQRRELWDGLKRCRHELIEKHPELKQ